MLKDFRFIEKANLPQHKVKHCILGENATEAIQFLKDYGIDPLFVKASSELDEEIASHADIQAMYCGSKTAVISPNQTDLIRAIFELGCRVEVAENKPFSPYPNDVLLNQTILNDVLIGNTDFASEKITEFASNNKLEILQTKQGYSKCSICIVSENAIITEDNGIANLLKNSQIDVLKIEPGNIYLSDKHYGFIGGASGKISKNEIFFNGNIEEHPSYAEIIAFLNNYNVKPVYSKSYKLTDIGSILPITELI